MKQSIKIPRIATLFVSLCVLACLSFGMVACSNADGEGQAQGVSQKEKSGDAYTFTDDLGNEVSVESSERVVACMGSFAEIWELSGGTLVGASNDAFEGYIDPTSDIAHIGDFTSPNLEEIIALSPDFVILTGAANGKDASSSQSTLRDSLEASGITTAYFTVTTFDDYLRMLEVCCGINDRPELLEANGTQVKESINTILDLAKEKNGQDISVLLMTTYSGGTRVQNSSTMTGSMIADLGVKNLADDNASLLKEFSLESVIEMNPDFILVVPMGNDDEAAVKNLEEATAANPAWETIDAVQNNHYMILDKDFFQFKPNNEWDISYQQLYNIFFDA